ncbi:hypothetical protein DSCOOX_49340 [Desulfosarcina ovata subsp. ovata]|uniref:Rhodanese domain-containing protein n=2 Tax=Desulfosarcina ovata TaxID=83564 RepID=A0A5K8AJA8_9BACT|nr:hypothetical protein DSCOOX_49340 [Desulfosarcina ovata subsp. ovata]
MAVQRPHWLRTQAGVQCMARLLGLLTFLVGATVGMDGFAYDLGVIDVKTLAAGKTAWIVLDARPPAVYRKGHLPGALSFSWEAYTRIDAQKIPYRIWPAAELAAALGGMGIDENAPIVVYGDADTTWGGEGWCCWALIWLGHQGPVRMLDGGVQAWQRAGMAMTDTDAPQSGAGATYHAWPRGEVTINCQEIADLADNQILVDTRSTLEWLTGHLPGAVHLSWTSLYEGKDRHPIDAKRYGELLGKQGIDADMEPVFYCTGGVRSAYAWVIHQLYMSSPARNFEGGTEAWDRYPNR